MPRKRPARYQTKFVNVDPDASISADGTDDKALKKEAFLRDFDIQVQKRKNAMETKTNSLVRDITRLFSSEKLKIKKEIRLMTVQEFFDRGGDFKTLDFSVIGNAVAQNDISFIGEIEDDTVVMRPPVSTAPRTRKRAAQIAESPLVNDAPLTRTRNRTRKPQTNTSLVTPSTSKRGAKNLQTPLITPKFDPRQPLTSARKPKRGETLMSLAGSPVVQPPPQDDADSLLSLCLDKQQTLLGGSLFDDTMSPGTLMKNKQRLQEAFSKINARLEDLDSQIDNGQSSRFNVT